jgi:hypothetical protein
LDELKKSGYVENPETVPVLTGRLSDSNEKRYFEKI